MIYISRSKNFDRNLFCKIMNYLYVLINLLNILYFSTFLFIDAIHSVQFNSVLNNLDIAFDLSYVINIVVINSFLYTLKFNYIVKLFSVDKILKILLIYPSHHEYNAKLILH